jgi:hypothetical protein
MPTFVASVIFCWCWFGAGVENKSNQLLNSKYSVKIVTTINTGIVVTI